MKTLSTGLQEHLAQEVTTLRTLVRVTRRDAQVFGFTDSDDDIEYQSVLYRARSGASGSAVVSGADLSTDNLEVLGLLSGSDITEADLEAGVWDAAQVMVSQVNAANLSQGELMLRVGQFGEVERANGTWRVEVRGLTNTLQRTITRTYLPTCDADLGDARCGVNLTSRTQSNTVATVLSARQFVSPTLPGAAGVYAGGRLTWTSGGNAGRQMEVLNNDGAGGVQLVLDMPTLIAVADQFTVVEGCNKTINHCANKFGNVVNFRGFPHVPGVDKTLRYGGS
jgi:uncharacterized phage protein (TIGR02218 family)